MDNVTPEYEAQLRDLAELIVTPERYGHTAVAEVIMIDEPSQLELFIANQAIMDDYS
jgi:hypothetical protein